MQKNVEAFMDSCNKWPFVVSTVEAPRTSCEPVRGGEGAYATSETLERGAFTK